MAQTAAAPNETQRRALGIGVLIAACVGCCSIPLLAGLTVFGVAVCSAKFLGVALAGVLTVAAVGGYVVYRRRRVCDCASGSCRLPEHTCRSSWKR